MVRSEAALERRPQGGQLRSQLALCELGQAAGVCLALAERPQHRLARCAEHVRGHVAELDVRVLEQVLSQKWEKPTPPRSRRGAETERQFCPRARRGIDADASVAEGGSRTRQRRRRRAWSWLLVAATGGFA